MSRITIAQVNARVDALAAAQETTNELLAKLVQAQAQYNAPATVVDLTEHKAAKATKAAPKVVSLKTAQKRVDAGEDAWKITVKSSNGNAVPFGLVLRASKAGARKAENVATTQASAKGNPFFAMSRKALIADGSKGAQAEIARRESKRAK